MTDEYADLADEELVERCMQMKRDEAACDVLYNRSLYYASDSSYLRKECRKCRSAGHAGQ